MKKLIENMGILLLLPLMLGLSSCGQKHASGDGHGHDAEAPNGNESGHDHGAEEAGASFEEGKGIRLPEESKISLGLEMVEVGEQFLTPTVKLTAQIYRASSEASRTHGRERKGNAYATALISQDSATELKPGQKVTFHAKGGKQAIGTGSVAKVETTQMAVLGKAEALLELPDSGHNLAVGDFVEAEVPIGKASRKTLSIPNSAVLVTSTGNFAYVLNGENLLRTEIKTGSKSNEFTEVVEGLYEGDTIAVKPVEALYLIELRATKGGGHSH